MSLLNGKKLLGKSTPTEPQTGASDPSLSVALSMARRRKTSISSNPLPLVSEDQESQPTSIADAILRRRQAERLKLDAVSPGLPEENLLDETDDLLTDSEESTPQLEAPESNDRIGAIMKKLRTKRDQHGSS